MRRRVSRWQNRRNRNILLYTILLAGICITWWNWSKSPNIDHTVITPQSIVINTATTDSSFDSAELLGIDQHANVSKIYHAQNEEDLIAMDEQSEMHAQLRQYLLKAEPFLTAECNYTNVRLQEYLQSKPNPPEYLKTLVDSWDRFYADISPCHLYQEESQQMKNLLHDLATKPYTQATSFERGTQVKLILWFGKKKALMKPLRYDLDYETSPNHFYFADFERANAEIAAFHLDRVLGFRKVIPTTGRVIKLSELKAAAVEGLAKTFFQSPINNTCFAGQCMLYCDVTHAVCGQPDTIFASVQAYLPSRDNVPRYPYLAPFKRTYDKYNQVADWQMNRNFCRNLKRQEPYSTDPRQLLDVIDGHIFDFLMANLDRHHFEVIEIFDQPAFPALNDHGRAFGRSYDDYTDNLAPLYQCCLIRRSTLKTLLRFDSGSVSLSDTLRLSLSGDALKPVLADKHFRAVDRRLTIVLRMILKCLQRARWPDDVIRAFFHNKTRQRSIAGRAKNSSKRIRYV